MATKTFEELKQLAIQIRDEKTNKQNTATRVGTAMLEHINKLEQDYYDKTQTDEELKERDDKLTELELTVKRNTAAQESLFNGKQDVSFLGKGYIATGGYEFATPDQDYGFTDYIPIVNIEYTIDKLISYNTYAVAAVAFYDKDKSFLGFIPDKDIASGKTIFKPSDYYENAELIRCTGVYSNGHVLITNKTINDIENTLIDNIDEQARDIPSEYRYDTVGGFISIGGWESAHDTYRHTDYIKVKKNFNYKIDALSSLNAYSVAAVAFYDKNKSYLGYIPDKDVKSGKVNFNPSDYYENSEYIRCTTEKSQLSIKEYSNVALLSEEVFNKNIDNIFFPKRIYAVEGELIQLFNRSLLDRYNYLNYNVVYEKTSEGNWLYLQNRGRYIEANIQQGDPSIKIKCSVYETEQKKIAESNECEIFVTKKGTSPSRIINVLMIGDSFTDQNLYPHELLRRLCANVETNPEWGDLEEPLIPSDNLNNINFIGTRQGEGNEPPMPYNEGWGGKDYIFFLGSESPFYFNGEVNFTSYMDSGNVKGTINNITEPGQKIDVAIIMLGTNLNHTEDAIKALWRKLIEHNSNIVIIVTGRVMCSPNGLGMAGGLSYNGRYLYKDSWSHNAGLWDYNRSLESYSLEEEFVNNVHYVDANIQLDSEYNFPYTNKNVNRRNTELKERIGEDNVHPSKYGYWQISDVFYNAFHALVLNKNW